MAAPLLDVRSVTKRFPGVRALDGVSLTLEPGRIHALVGENGAGKSTLIRILAGVLRADEGEVLLGGRSVAVRTPHHARRLGIATVHQHTHLIPDLTVAENHALRVGYPRGAARQIAWGRVRDQAQAATTALAPRLDVRRTARSLSGVEKQLVELSFALAAGPRLLILDEPTAVLPRHETQLLFGHLRRFAAEGGCVLFISHRLREVFDLAHDVAVLRDGRLVWRKATGDTDHDGLIRAMVGRDVSFARDPDSAPGEGVCLRIAGLCDRAGAFADVSLDVRRGEIYGIYGLVGAGQSELCQALFGLRETRGGTVRLGGDALERTSPGRRVAAGVGYVPADRLAQGIFARMSVGENLSIASMARLAPRGWLRVADEEARNRASIERLRIRTLGPEQPVAKLSGGNQQKVLLGRWLQAEPSVLLLEEPTQGVDVGAKGEIHRRVRRLAADGVSVLLVSSELPELMALAHRIGIFREGRLAGEVDAASAREEEILRLALPEAERSSSERRATGREAGEVPGALGLAARRSRLAARWLASQREASIALVVALLALALGLTTRGFATLDNLNGILVNTSVTTIGALTDHFLCFGKRAGALNETRYEPELPGGRYYLWTSATLERETQARIVASAKQQGTRPHASEVLTPTAVFLNGTGVEDLQKPVPLRSGPNPILVRYDQAGRGYFVVEREGADAKPSARTPLAMNWFDDPSVIRFDVLAGARPAESFRFTAPPGLRAMAVTARGSVESWADGQPMRAAGQGRFEAAAPLPRAAVVALRVVPDTGAGGAAVFPEPVRLECGPGIAPLGDWAKMRVLECYSGGAWYRKTVSLTAEQIRLGAMLDLGKVVATAEVRVNGQPAGIRVAPPWRVDISKHVKAGENRIEVLVYNTLANHYLTIPTRYRGELTSGLLGPVTVEVAAGADGRTE